jgi:hypothetical protein
VKAIWRQRIESQQRKQLAYGESVISLAEKRKYQRKLNENS